MVTIPHAVTLQLIKDPHALDLYLEYIAKYMGFRLADWQYIEFKNLVYKSKYLMNWGRGMSKTLILTLKDVFRALLGCKQCYCVPRVDEITQPIEYFNNNPFVDANPYKRTNDKSFSSQKGIWFSVMGKPAIKLVNIDDKGFNLSSGRFNGVTYDECSLLMYYKQEVELLNKGKGMLRAMDYPAVAYASTPLIGSHFFDLFENYPADAKSWRNFENTPNNFITNTPEKMAQILEERAEAEQMGILYAWETENLAIPHTAMGAAFKNILVEDITTFPSQTANRAGFDFHGYQTGHIWVATYYNPQQSPADIYVIDEGAEVYEEKDTADESMHFLADNPYFRGLYLVGESGGMINDPYIKCGRKFGMNAVSINGEEKHDLEANILNFRVHIDKKRCPNTYEDLSTAEWKDPNKFELHKEPSGNKFRNHYLDAFANQCPRYTVGKGVYIPNRQLRRVSFEEQDRMAHRIRI